MDVDNLIVNKEFERLRAIYAAGYMLESKSGRISLKVDLPMAVSSSFCICPYS